MHLLHGNNKELAFSASQFGHDKALGFKSVRSETLNSMLEDISNKEHQMELLDSLIERMIEGRDNEDDLRNDKETLLGSTMEFMSQSVASEIIASSLGVERDKLSENTPYEINGVDMTVTGTSIDTRSRRNFIDMLEDILNRIGVDTQMTKRIVGKLESAEDVKAFTRQLEMEIINGKLGNNISIAIVQEQQLDRKLENEMSMKP